eukprot:COSAG01_NODE_1237_length_11098_cov_7.982726_12_plen_50_part_00
MDGVHYMYPTNAGQASARREAIGGDARPGSEVPILITVTSLDRFHGHMQ